MSVTDDIKARIDILDLMQSYNVPLHKAGHNYKAPCPFHNERTPSFVVFPDSGTWRCFGACGEGGDVFGFVMKQEGVDFAGALELLAGRAGVELKPRTSEQKSRDAVLDRMRGLLDETTRFFHDQLLHAEGAEIARAYVAKRGLRAETLDRFMIGYAPHDWRQALIHLGVLGYSEDEIIGAGVATRNEKGKVYDRFRNRLIIPIHDGRGQIVGYGARALAAEDNPKYLNSPQTPLFDKGHTLFALDAARRMIRETETVVIVEGYMDALQAHQAGFSNVVAQMGTALTEPQLKQLTRYAKRLILALDPDAAGVNATLRGLNVARQTLGEYASVFDANAVLRQSSKLDVDIRVITLPDGQDPDDLIRDTPERWPQLVETAQPIVDYIIESGTAGVTPQTPLTERERIARDLLPALLENQSYSHYSVQRLAVKLRINERDLIGLAQRQQKAASPEVPIVSRKPAKAANARVDRNRAPVKIEPIASTADIAEEGALLSALLQRPELWSIINRHFAQLTRQTGARDALLGAFCAKDFTRTDYQVILETLKAAIDQDTLDPLDYLQEALPADMVDEANRLLNETMGGMKSPENWKRDMESILKEKSRVTLATTNPEGLVIEKALALRSRRLRREIDELQFLEAEGQGYLSAIPRSRYRMARHCVGQAIDDLRSVHNQA